MLTMAETTYNPHDVHTYPYSFQEKDIRKDMDDKTFLMIDELERIHVVLQAIHKHLAEPSHDEIMDERFIITLYKSGLGSNWIPNKRGKFYIYVYAPVATALNVTSPLGAPFVLTVPAPTFPNLWNLFDLPDQSSIILDTTATSNQMNLNVLLTDRKL